MEAAHRAEFPAQVNALMTDLVAQQQSDELLLADLESFFQFTGMETASDAMFLVLDPLHVSCTPDVPAAEFSLSNMGAVLSLIDPIELALKDVLDNTRNPGPDVGSNIDTFLVGLHSGSVVYRFVVAYQSRPSGDQLFGKCTAGLSPAADALRKRLAPIITIKGGWPSFFPLTPAFFTQLRVQGELLAARIDQREKLMSELRTVMSVPCRICPQCFCLSKEPKHQFCTNCGRQLTEILPMPSGRPDCCACQKPIPDSAWVECDECEGVCFCIWCFDAGLEHDPSHALTRRQRPASDAENHSDGYIGPNEVASRPIVGRSCTSSASLLPETASTDRVPKYVDFGADGLESAPLPLVLTAAEENWYCADLDDGTECDLDLDNRLVVTGSFLVRPSFNRPGGFTLSVRNGETIEHIAIHKRESQFQIKATAMFESLPQLIAHYRTAGFQDVFTQISTGLLYPRGLGPYVNDRADRAETPTPAALLSKENSSISTGGPATEHIIQGHSV